MTSTVETKLSPRVIEIAARCAGITSAKPATVRLTGDASTRSYFRAQGGGASVVVALYAEPFDETTRAIDRLAASEAADPMARLTFANDPCAHIEVTNLLLDAGLPAPRILAASGLDCAIFIEDVGDVRLQEWLVSRSAEESKAAYRRAVEMIVRIQEATERALSTNSICSHLAFDEMKLKWELGFFFANYFNRYLGLRLDSATAVGVQEEFKAICSELAARPRVLAHRDYHARNLMMREGEMFIIDHQDARMGPASYDLASLLSDPYTALDRETAREMVEHFISLKSVSAVPIENVGEFRRELEMMTVQRMLKAIGTYSYQAAALNNPVYVAYIKPAIEAALASSSALGRFDRIRALLERTRN